MNALSRTLTLTAALATLAVAPRSEAGVRVSIGVPAFRTAVRVVARPAVVVGVRPSAAHVWVEGAWVLPPYPGAVWAAGHPTRYGVWSPGHWRS